MTTKECKDKEHKRSHRLRRLFWLLTIFLFVVFLVILLIWAILQPQKPRFVIEDATVYTFNVTSPPNIFTSTFQVTITSRNPNDKIGIYYDKLDVYASYRSQQVTYCTAIPPTYQARKGINTWSPFVSGDSIPISPVNSMALSADQANGAILLLIKMDGRVRWRVGSFISGRYRFHVICPAYMPFGEKNPNFIVGTAVKYQLYVNCKVSI